jgi:hypothetical protein
MTKHSTYATSDVFNFNVTREKGSNSTIVFPNRGSGPVYLYGGMLDALRTDDGITNLRCRSKQMEDQE